LGLIRKHGALWASIGISLGLHGVALAALAWTVAAFPPGPHADGARGPGDGLLRITLVWEDAGTSPTVAAATSEPTPAPVPTAAPVHPREPFTLPPPAPATPPPAPIVAAAAPRKNSPANDDADASGSAAGGASDSGPAARTAAGSGAAPARGPLARVARPLSEIRPDYPRRARERGEEAEVIVEAWVEATGRVARTRVRKSGGHEFDAAALQAVDEARFEPAWSDGAPVDSVVAMRLHFALER